MLETNIQLFGGYTGETQTQTTTVVSSDRHDGAQVPGTNYTRWSENTASTDNDLSAEMKTYYEKRLIETAEPELIFDQFADTYDIPAKNGKTIEFRKFEPLYAGISETELVEGVTPKGNRLDVKKMTSEVKQYGDFVELSDLIDMTAIDPVAAETTKLLGSQSGRVMNKVTREVLSTGLNVRRGVSGAKTRAELTLADKLTPALIRKAANDLKRFNAPKIDGSYIAIVHPDVATELMGNSEWIEAQKYTGEVKKIYEGEVGKLAGVRFIENTEAKIWKDSTCPTGTNTDNLAVYACYFLAKGAFATTKLANGGLQSIIKPLGSGEDPLNQRMTIGWKGTKTAEILVDEYMVRVEVCTDDSDSEEVEAN